MSRKLFMLLWCLLAVMWVMAEAPALPATQIRETLGAEGGRANLLGADRSSTTNITITSESVRLLARKFQPVIRKENGEIVNDMCMVASAADVNVISNVSAAASELSEAAHVAMTNAMQYIYTATASMASNMVGVAIAFAPENDVSNMTFYVCHEETDGEVDKFYIWTSHQVSLAPNVFMGYYCYKGETTVKLSWEGGWNNLTNVVNKRGQLWEGCHVGYCRRPMFAENTTCITEPNLPLGGDSGFNFGGVTFYNDVGERYYTGIVTNQTDELVMYIEDGFVKGITSYTPTGKYAYRLNITAADGKYSVATYDADVLSGLDNVNYVLKHNDDLMQLTAVVYDTNGQPVDTFVMTNGSSQFVLVTDIDTFEFDNVVLTAGQYLRIYDTTDTATLSHDNLYAVTIPLVLNTEGE